ncbi:hypothetical protein ALSL_2303 [Aerosticca soli]|uniref:Uncharacterized protein n=1 Tax=Aerosticca soli TaxID=2010829 RepID=A0A2Z6E8P7_9GAMM|nr:hypothetical protein ALSL_2303 [Aerosticca soli]
MQGKPKGRSDAALRSSGGGFFEPNAGPPARASASTPF